MAEQTEKIFGSISDLPSSVRDRLSPAEQRTWLRVFNRTFRQTNGGESRKESAAFRAANGIVRQMGKDRELEDETGFEKRVRIEKIDEEQRMVWGWAYVCIDENGQQVVDHSGQIVSLGEIHKAAHGFMRDFRIGGEMHRGDVGSVPESIVVTDAVAAELGMTTRKRGWFIGCHVDDDDAWEGVKAGRYKAFSIGGTADVETL